MDTVAVDPFSDPRPAISRKKARILVVDDEEDIAEVISYNLAKEGYEVECAHTGESALERLTKEKPDILLLDLMLPGIDGLDVCKSVKAHHPFLPVIMISAKGDESDVVTGLELGADDYITKPFSQKILLARVKSALRRTFTEQKGECNILSVGSIQIDIGRHEVKIQGEKIDLTPTEFELLAALAKRAGFVMTRYQIVEAVRGADFAVTARSVDVQIVGLRKKLKSASPLIETVRGVGYRLVEEPL
jgi:two-component system, OmpR family, alkaline phosphatase synthesis response regulator PhoP